MEEGGQGNLHFPPTEPRRKGYFHKKACYHWSNKSGWAREISLDGQNTDLWSIEYLAF